MQAFIYLFKDKQDPHYLYERSLLDCMALCAMREEYTSLLLCSHYNKKNDLQTFG